MSTFEISPLNSHHNRTMMGQTTSKSGPKVEMLVIDEERAGQRIDNYLIGYLKGIPKSRIYRLLRKGEVRVNKGRIKPDYKLQAGDQVRIPPVQRPIEADYARNRPNTRVLSQLEQSIIYQDKRLIALNKPPGLAVHGGSGVDYGVIEGIRALYPDLKHLELVHRLDRDTSGCLLIAKRRSMLRHLHEQFRENLIKKRYVALVAGKWPDGVQTVDAPLRKNTLRSGERIVKVDEQGKPATSIFRPIHRFRNCSFVEVELITGRTHQIRVHAAHAGHPIIGDEKYGDKALNTEMKELGMNRLYLHAKLLSFPLPLEEGEERHQILDITAPIGGQWEAVLERLKADLQK